METTTRNRRWVLRGAMAAAGTAMLGACTTPYQPKGAMGGFAEQKLGPDRYSVEFTGNGNTSAELVANLFLYRCAELTVTEGFDVFRSADPTSPGAQDWAMPLAAEAGAGADAQPTEFRSGATRTVPVYIPSAPRTVTIHKMVGMVRMGRYADVPSTVRVWDARLVMKQLDPLVKGASRAPMSPEAIAKVALVSGRGQAGVASGGTSLDDLRRLLAQPQD